MLRKILFLVVLASLSAVALSRTDPDLVWINRTHSGIMSAQYTYQDKGFITTGSDSDGTLKLWHMPGFVHKKTVFGPIEGADTSMIEPVAIKYVNSRLTLIDSDTGSTILQVSIPGRITNARFSHDGQMIAVVTDNISHSRLTLIRRTDFSQVYTRNITQSTSLKAAWSADDSRIAIHSETSGLEVYFALTGTFETSINQATEFKGVEFLDAGTTLVAINHRGAINIWDIPSRTITRDVRGNLSYNLSGRVRLSPDRTKLAAVTFGRLTVFSTTDWSTLFEHDNSSFTVNWNSSSNELAVGRGASLEILSVPDGELVAELLMRRGPFYGDVVSFDDVVALSSDSSSPVINLDGSVRYYVPADIAQFDNVLDYGGLATSKLHNADLAIVNANDGAIIDSVKCPIFHRRFGGWIGYVRDLCISPDGSKYVVATNPPAVIIFDRQTRKLEG